MLSLCFYFCICCYFWFTSLADRLKERIDKPPYRRYDGPNLSSEQLKTTAAKSAAHFVTAIYPSAAIIPSALNQISRQSLHIQAATIIKEHAMRYQTLKMGIVGAGLWGEAHASIYREHPHAEPVAICDIDLPRAQTFAQKFVIPQVYADYHQMLEQSGCDAVAIVTPDFLHTDIALACARAGKHMIIEKPLATTRQDVLAIMQAVQDNGVRAMVDLHNRWNPPFNTVRQLVQSGRYGQARSAHFRLNDCLWVATDMLKWCAKSSILWFLGSHSLDTMNWVLGDSPTRVYAAKTEGKLKALGIDTVDTYMTTIQYAGGAIAQMENSWVTPNGNPNVNDFKFNLLCTEGKFDIDASSHNLLQVTDHTRMITQDVLVKNQVFGRHVGFAYESIRSFVDQMISGEEFHVTLREAANVSLALLAVMQSAESGLPVEVERI